MTRASLVVPSLAIAACTAGPGDGFGTLRDVELSAHLEGGPEVTTDLGYAIDLRVLSVEVDHLVLQDLTGDAPAGEGGGHAHGEEEPAEPTGGGEPVALAGAEVGAALDALAAEPVEVDRFEPSRELPFGAIRRIVVELDAVRLEAVVDGPGLAEPLAVEADLPIEIVLVEPTLRPLDRDSDHGISLVAEVSLGPGLLDGIDFASLADGPALRWDDPASPGARALLEALAASELHVAFDGSEPHE